MLREISVKSSKRHYFTWKKRKRLNIYAILLLIPSFLDVHNYSCLLSDLAFEWQQGWRWLCFYKDLTAFVVYLKLFLVVVLV